MSKESDMLHTFICEMENTLKDKNKRNRAYAPQVFWKNKYTLEIIETKLKDYEELTNKPVILYGRTHGYTQALIDTICKNYKEVKITNLEDEKKLKALEIIKETPIFAWYVTIYKDAYEMVADAKGFRANNSVEDLQQMFDLLKEVLL